MPTEHAPGQQLDSPAMPEGKPPGTTSDSGPTIDPVCRALGLALPPVFQELPHANAA